MKSEPRDSPGTRVRLRLICGPLPAASCGIYTGIRLTQQLGGNHVPGEERPDGSLVFDCEVRARRDDGEDAPNFVGEAVSGPRGGRFLYLAWFGVGELEEERFRRMKIPLGSITWDQVAACVRESKLLEARVSGIGRDGLPACATVPLLDGGWKVVDP